MLSLFPSLFDYSALAVGVLRLVVALVFIMEGYKNLSQKDAETRLFPKFLSYAELIGGVLLFSGLLTQASALILGSVALKKTYIEHRKEPGETMAESFYFLLFIISISFIFLGPGLWSIDYPL